MKFEWKYCPTCETMMVICPQCGNNSCNGGSGTLKDGTRCAVCDLAYQYFSQAVETNSVPPFPSNKQELDDKNNNWMRENFGVDF